MSAINRRQWIQKSLLASSGMLLGRQSAALPAQSNSKLFEEAPYLKLNWNENPYGPSKKALQAIVEALQSSNRYVDHLVEELKNKLAAKYVLEGAQLMLTAGSTEVLSLLGQHVGLQQGEILTPWPSFPTMVLFGDACGAHIRKVPLNREQQIALDPLLASISQHTTLVFICNPNNPTSTELDTATLKAFCRAVPDHVLICIDEAYIEYSKQGTKGSMIPLVDELPNLIICRTFSKAYGLAGLRIGYAVSNQANITALRRRHLGWELSAGLAPLVAALTTLDDGAFLQDCVQKNEEGRRIVYEAFDQWGVQYSPSSTNFIYAQSKHFDKDIRAKLQAENILITKWPDMTDHIRISIGKPEEMRQFVVVAKRYLV